MKVAALLLLASLLACTRGGAAPDDAGTRQQATITVKGSDTMVVLGQRWAEEYMLESPGVSVEVTGGGSGTGIAALINGSVDVCESSREMSPKERAELLARRGAPAVETRVAVDAVAVYVNERCPLREITLAALGRVYRGETVTWRDLGGSDHPIVAYGRENNSGTYAFFKEHVLGGKDFAPSVQALAGTAAIAHAVKGDEYGIGYGGIAYAPGVRALGIKGEDGAPAVAPSQETALGHTYPLSRFLYFYTAGRPRPAVDRFVAWVTSARGQKTVADVGYYPLPKSGT